MDIRNHLEKDHPYYESKTEKQWNKEYRKVLPEAAGMKMYANGHRNTICVFFKPSETRPASPVEIEGWKTESRNKAKERRARIKAKQQEEERRKKEHLEKQQTYLNGLSKTDPPKIICLDIETTGLNPEEDEIIQLSIMDGTGKVLFNEYIKPQHTESWPEAAAINGIEYKHVKNKQTIHAHLDKINAIVSDSELIVTYNGNLCDLPFLRASGVLIPEGISTFDVMLWFADIYGEWDLYHKCNRWQKLKVCAEYYGYESNGAYHDSMEDVRTTLFCFFNILKSGNP